MRSDSDSRLVYSTENPNQCDKCGKKIHKCKCGGKKQPLSKGDGIVRICRETKGRKGKGVTLVTGVDRPEKELKILAKELKQQCGTGGTLKNGIIEIQGDHRNVIMEALKKAGYAVKLAGG